MHRQSPVIFNSCMSQFSIFCSTSQSFPMVRRPWNKMQEGLGYITSIQNLKILRKKLFEHLGILVEQILNYLTIKIFATIHKITLSKCLSKYLLKKLNSNITLKKLQISNRNKKFPYLTFSIV